ncbi:autotransporter outer membrane beta-barrel domain-containing protein [Pandoraea oxalativorans]|uniref:Autotransporter domain-containing protein n=1 Tax=Pandoraea oxalativorans TaxID=573737 RepID=A0A0G3IBZ4_9BURK|nr:autotransporter domain-containing protein [Pandoraea oxalativorans]AKK24777.1 hypothetical protein MB84_28695 [Pandoraea oxalativorans]
MIVPYRGIGRAMPRARPEAGDPGGAYPASRTGLDVSREQGKRVALDNGWQVETSAQRMSQSVSFRNTTDKNGVSVALGTSHAWTTLAGVRFSYPVAGIPSSWTPYVGDGLSYTWSGGRESGARRRRVCARQRGRGGARGSGRKRSGDTALALYGALYAQTGVDSYGVLAIGGRLGVRYRF